MPAVTEQPGLFDDPADPRCPKCGHTEAVHCGATLSHLDGRGDPIIICHAQDFGKLHGCACHRPATPGNQGT